MTERKRTYKSPTQQLKQTTRIETEQLTISTTIKLQGNNKNKEQKHERKKYDFS